MRRTRLAMFGPVVLASWLHGIPLSGAEADRSSLPNWSRATSVGFNLNQAAQDFGYGLTVTSPFFLDDRVAVRASVNQEWHAGAKAGREAWIPYSSFRLGVLGAGGRVGGFVRLYGEGGVLYLRTNADLSDHDHWGGYGLFGFEFLLTQGERPKMSYFAELGSVGTGARAEKLPTQPFYSNGFSVSVGLRLYVK